MDQEKRIVLRGARVNNLKNVDVEIPLKKFTIITGLSGSGKSSLVFDTLYAEGQRRYVESLSTYTRQFLEKMPKPDIDSIENICPSIALEQKNHINNSRSTVATMSELYDYFRLLFAKIGRTICVSCGKEVVSDNPASIGAQLRDRKDLHKARFYVLARINPEKLQKKTWDETRKSLLLSGFERIALEEKEGHFEAQEISPLEKLPAKSRTGFVILDRMTMPEEPSKDPRLMDALEQAFRTAAQFGEGTVALGLVDADKPTEWALLKFSQKFACDTCNIEYKKPEPQMFSFNSPLGACEACSGFGYNLELDENLIVPDKRKTLKNGAIDPLSKPASSEWQEDMFKFCEKHKIQLGKRYEDLSKKERDLLWDGDGAKKSFPGIRGYFEELKSYRYKLHVRVFIRRYQSQNICSVCNGSRFKQSSLAVYIGAESARKNIAEILSLSIEDANQVCISWSDPKVLTQFEREVAKDILKQIQGRLLFLNNVGVGYLTMNRLGKTLSGGECQRINLATQLGNKLCATLYVLDEPSIGLHPADTDKLITLLHQLRDHGNTLVVVEHDLEVINSADHLIELGPYAGYRGGEVIVNDTLSKVKSDSTCLTAKYLDGTFFIEKPKLRRKRTDKSLRIEGACENNLRDVDVEFPLYQLIAVTGLSGSGKTTLVHKTLYNALSRVFHKENLQVGKFLRLYGADYLNDVVLLDQRPIGKSSRSNPATYLKIWDDVRKIYSNQSLSIRRGYAPQHFSFNVDGGRCPVCKGEGEVTLDMHFMSELKLPCEECDGKRFKKNVLEVEFKKKNVNEILHTTIDECLELFREYPQVTSKLQILKNVGLGYLELGQSSTTLSGGESQRLKIASVLTSKTASNMLYIFDEPTTGLHVDDIKRLNYVLHDLVDQKNTVIVIEHNMDLVAQADWVIDIGPGGGIHGGEVVAVGTPEDLADNPKSMTGKYLKKALL